MTYLILLLCGILTALPYIFDFLFFMPYLTIAPLFIIAHKSKKAYRHGLCFSMGYYLVVYHWFLYLYPLDFAGFDTLGSIAVIAVAWFGLSLLQAIGTAFVPVIYRHLTKDKHWLLSAFAGASVWCICEWFQNLFWFGVPWARLAVTQYKILPIIQSASVLGSLGVGFIIVLIASLLSVAYERYKSNGNKEFKFPTIIAASVFAANFIFGSVVLCIPEKKHDQFTVAAIQGNIGSSDKWADNSVENSLDLYSELTRKAVTESGAMLAVWPETVIISDLNNDVFSSSIISSLSKELRCYIAVGAFYTENDNDYNAIYLFQPDGKICENVYKKRHLVPFGEYLPMSDFLYTVLPVLKEIIMLKEPLTPGTSSEIFNTELGKIGSLVCFDSIYEGLSLKSVRDGASFIVLSTNDSWYKDSAAVRQHNGHAVLRAVENGRYVVRAANTGISSVITDKGKIRSSLGALKTGYVTSDIISSNNKTVYYYLGNTIVLLSFIYLSYLALDRIMKHFRKNIAN